MGSLALDEGMGLLVWRHRLVMKLQLPNLTDLDSTIFSALAMCVTGFVISGFDLGDAGRIPLSPGEGHVPLAARTISWFFLLTTAGLILANGRLPNFSFLGHTKLRDVLGAWDVVARRVGDPAAALLLGAISGSFTPWVKDLARWASTRHPEELARPLKATIRDPAASMDHDVEFLGKGIA